MTRSLLGRLRRFWLDVHLWIGVGLLVLLIPLGISGSILVWHDGLDRALNAKRFEITGPAAQPPSAYIAAAREAFGDKAIVATLRMPSEPADPVTVVGRVKGPPGPGGRPAQLTAWIDPATAKVLDVADIRQSFTGVTHRLHGSLLIASPQGLGRKIVGWLGWAMSVSCLTGLWLWWPRNGAVLKALRWRRSPSTLNNLHHMFGFWILIPLLVVSLTGVYISFPQTARALFGVAQPGQQQPRGPRPAGPPPMTATNLGPDTAADLAVRANPGTTLAVLNLPTEGKKAEWKVELAKPGEERPVQAKVSDVDGAVSAGRDERGGGGGPDPLSKLMRQIHDGADTPFVWQVLVFLTGLAPALLGTTGTVMWLRRRHRRKLIRRGHDEAVA